MDIDPRHGGDDTLLQLEQDNGKLPDTVESLTGGGGRHIFLKHPGGRISNDQTGQTFGAGIDVRADGGYVVAPPSNHISGIEYMWEASSEPTMGIKPAPKWVLDRLNHQNVPGTNNNKTKNGGSQKIQAGRRNTSLTSFAGRLRKQGMDEQQIVAALKSYNQANCTPPLTDKEVEAIAKSVSRYTGAAPDDDDLAQLWIDEHPDMCYGLGEFRRYIDGLWPQVNDYVIEAEIQNFLAKFKGNGVRISHNKLTSIKKLARNRCVISDEQWNADPNLLACRNGTLHISTRKIQPHKPDNYLTTGVPFDYNPNATAPYWMSYLNDLHPDIVSFLQEYVGYCLTTDTSLETAVWLYGPMGCGKSTFITGMLTVLGDRAGLLGLYDIERSQFSLGSLPGKTMVYSTEQPNEFISVTHILNALISGEPINIQRKYKDQFTLIPQAKLIWAMNEMPRVGDASNGLFRRVYVIPFQKLSKPKDEKLKENIQGEGSGILLWALEGLERLKVRGRFAPPKIIIDASNRFKLDNDVPQLFIRECCEVNQQFDILSSSLYFTYRDWCFKNGYKAMASNTVAKHWERLGFVAKHTKNGNYWQGLRLLSQIP